jgi:hypothetical protein
MGIPTIYLPATRTVSTTTASASLGGSSFTGQVSTLNSKFTSNTIIKAEHFVDLANLLIQAAGHTHDWTDMFGMHISGNYDNEGYGPRGRTEANSVEAIGTNFGLLDGASSGEIVDRSHFNYMVTVYNGLRNHNHLTNDAVS